jgi:hypothetical protein
MSPGQRTVVRVIVLQTTAKRRAKAAASLSASPDATPSPTLGPSSPDDTNQESSESSPPEVNGDGSAGESEETDSLEQTNLTPGSAPLLKKASAGELTNKEVESLVEEHFAKDIRLFLEFTRLFQSTLFDPHKAELLNSSMLITSVAAFETLLAGVLTQQYECFPGILQRDDLTFSLKDLFRFSSIEEARTFAVEQRVDAMMRDGYEKCEKSLRDSARIELSDACMDHEGLCEIFQRRHILVHNAGRVSRQYLAKVPSSSAELGRILSVDADYLSCALDELTVAGVALGVTAWCKWFSTEAETAVGSILPTTYELLNSDRYAACIALCEVGRNLGGGGWTREALLVNAWIARKALADVEAIRDDVEAWDVSALSPLFALARVTLLDDLDAAFSMLPELIKTEIVSLDQLAEWPLFRTLRADPRYEALSAAGD